MSWFLYEGETVKVDLPDEQWAVLKEDLTQDDQDELFELMAGTMAKEVAKIEGSDEAPEEKAKKQLQALRAYRVSRRAVMAKMVVEWSFPIPITMENCARLRMKYRVPILDKIDELTNTAKQKTEALKNALEKAESSPRSSSA